MKYYEFKIAYDNQTDLTPQFFKCQKILFELQRLFDDNFNSVFLGNSYDYTIWYNNLFNEFKQVFVLNLNEAERLIKVIEIYKNLFLKCSEMNNKNNKNNKTLIFKKLIRKIA